MRAIELPFVVLRLQYRITRAPLQFIEERFVSRMDCEAPARLLCERSIGRIDATVGTVLRESKLRLRGQALAERRVALGRAAALDDAAARKKEEVDDELQQKSEQTANAKDHARVIALQEVQDARTEAASKRAHADRVEDLADTEKELRTEARRKDRT
jgi:hypothetical protein